MGFGNRREFAGGIVVEPNVGFDKRSFRVLGMEPSGIEAQDQRNVG